MDRERLLEDIDRAYRQWDERSQFRISGIGNLSCSDLETIELYAKTEGIGLMRPVGSVAMVLEKYGFEYMG